MSHNEHGTTELGPKYFCDKHLNGGPRETLFFPIFIEENIPVGIRGALYLLLMFYLLVGISIAVNIFMHSIDQITSQMITIKIKGPRAAGSPSYKSVPLWNPVVAITTLAALGTCSPEIMLTSIEVVGELRRWHKPRRYHIFFHFSAQLSCRRVGPEYHYWLCCFQPVGSDRHVHMGSAQI